MNTTQETIETYGGQSVYGIFLIVEALVIVVGNGLVVVVYIKSRDLRIPAMLCITAYAVDMLFLGFYIIIYRGPVAFMDLGSCDQISHKLANAMFLMTSSHSLHSLVICVIDRYVAICKPLRYAKNISNRCIFYSQGISLTILALIAVVLFTTSTEVHYNYSFHECQIETSLATFVIFISCYPIPAIGTGVFCYFCIVREVVKKRRVHPDPENPLSNVIPSRIKVPTTVTSLVICTGVTYVWVAFLSSFKQTNSADGATTTLAEIGMFIFYGNGIFSTLIFSINLQPFKESVMKLYCHDRYRKRLQRKFINTITNQSSERP